MKPKPVESPFAGIDRSDVKQGTFSTGAGLADGGALTVEAIEAGIKAILDWKPPVPCGSDDKHPHITQPVTLPADRGKPVQCVNCGTWVAYTSENRGVDIGGPGLFTDALFGGRAPLLKIEANPDCPPDRVYFVPTTMTPAEESDAALRIAAGEDAALVALDVVARRSLMVKL